MEDHNPYAPSETTEIHGLEVLSIKDAELTKHRGSKNFFSSIGTLSVLYFESYDKFMLKINDWYYVLMTRLPVRALTKVGVKTRFYVFPGYDGTFVLKIKKIPHIETLENFETILSTNSHFSYQTEVEAATMHVTIDDVDLGLSNKPVHGTPDALSQMEMLVDTDVGKLSGKQKLKEGLHKLTSKFHRHRTAMQKHNPTLAEIKAYKDLKHSGVDTAFLYPLARKNLEQAIVRSKQILELLEDHEIRTTTTERQRHSTIKPNGTGSHSEEPVDSVSIGNLVEERLTQIKLPWESVDDLDNIDNASKSTQEEDPLEVQRDYERRMREEKILNEIRESERRRAKEADLLERFKRSHKTVEPTQRNPALLSESEFSQAGMRSSLPNKVTEMAGEH